MRSLCSVVIVGASLAACSFDASGPLGRGGVGLAPTADAQAVSSGSGGNPDAVLDPCGTVPAPAPPAGTLAIRCRIGTPPTLDGDLSDWSDAAFTSVTHTAAALAGGIIAWTGDPNKDDPDSSVAFSLAWDLDYLYIAGRVTDDARGVHPTAADPFRDDSFELYVDGMADRTLKYGDDDHQLVATADGRIQQYKDGTPADPLTGAAIKVADTGMKAHWALEAKVPWSVLGPRAVATGREIGFDVELNDDDDKMMQTWRHYLIWAVTPTLGPCTVPACNTGAFGTGRLVGR